MTQVTSGDSLVVLVVSPSSIHVRIGGGEVGSQDHEAPRTVAAATGVRLVHGLEFGRRLGHRVPERSRARLYTLRPGCILGPP